MPRKSASSFALINAALRGGLPGRLSEWREEGLSYRQMAAKLTAEGFPVSYSTVLRWVRALEEKAA